MQKTKKLQQMAQAGLIAAMYTVLCVGFPALGYGPIQFRLSEILTILPVFTPAALPGLAVGCVVSNLFGLSMGVNPAGMWDLLFGPLATLSAAMLTYCWRHVRLKGLPVLATLPPVLINAVVVGLELAIAYFDFTWPIYGLCALEVGLGQLAMCTGGGLLFFAVLQRSGAADRLFGHRRPIS